MNLFRLPSQRSGLSRRRESSAPSAHARLCPDSSIAVAVAPAWSLIALGAGLLSKSHRDFAEDAAPGLIELTE
jgi:hypothetical protein